MNRLTLPIDEKFGSIYLYFTDGSSMPNYSGWAWYSPFEGVYYSKKEEEKTNNYCELSALLNLLEYIYKNKDMYIGGQIFIYTDSEYSRNSYINWMDQWEKNDWKKSDGKIIQNKDIIIKLYEIKQKLDKIKKIKIIVNHVESHKKNNDLLSYCNNIVDLLAKSAK